MRKPTSYNSTRQVDSAESLDERFENLTLRFYRTYTRYLVINKMYRDSVTIQWSCFECKAPVYINIEPLLKHGRFNQSELFCSKHKPDTHKIFQNHLFIRYESSFYSKLKEEIINKSFKF